VKSSAEKYKSALSSRLDDQYVALYWKARVGLYALLKTMGVGPGDEVILPAFTCVVVPSAVIYLGATPVYVDIDQETFSASVAGIEKAITENTKVVICQNTFGLSVEIEKIVAVAKERGIYTIEDCTHGFGGTHNGKPNGVYCDAAIYSTQWNKPFSTGVGGFASVRNEALIGRLEEINQEATNPGVGEQVQLLVLMVAKLVLLNRYSYWVLIRLYRWLSSKNIVVGSSSPDELEGVDKPSGYFKNSGALQSFVGNIALKKLPEAAALRIKNGQMYSELLLGLGKNHVAPAHFKNHGFLVYPLLVHDRPQFTELAEKHGISLNDWFNSPLHPIEGSLEPWQLDVGRFPGARYCSKHIVNISTNNRRPELILEFLREHSAQLIDHPKSQASTGGI